jgi:hypothetical protein
MCEMHCIRKSLHTDVDVRLGTLERRGQTTGSHFVFEENMLNRVDSTGPQQRGSAGAQEEVGGSGDARHDDCPERRNDRRKTTKDNAMGRGKKDESWRCAKTRKI